MSRIGTWGLRLLLRCGFLFGEKGKSGAGILARSNKSGICRFDYRYDGTIGGNNYSYTVAEKDGVVTFTYESMRGPNPGKAAITADKSVLEKLNGLYLTYRIAAWNGYSKYNKRIRDGRGFSLSMKFNDGADFYAYGMNAFPFRYDDFVEAMKAVLDPLKDRIDHSE